MTDNKSSKKPSPAPVIYVHAKGRTQASQAEVNSLLELDIPLCSRLKYKDVKQTTHGYDQPGQLLAELSGLFPGRPVIFLRAGLSPAKQLLVSLSGLLDQTEQALALTLLSNADASVNPFSGLQASSQVEMSGLADLVALLAPGRLHHLSTWTDHFVLLSANLVVQLGKEDSGDTLKQGIQAIGAALKVPDHLFLPDMNKNVFAHVKLKPHESACPPVFGELSARLQNWFDVGIENLPLQPGNNKSTTLHITHSWGGGVAQWLNSFIRTDNNHQHLQLRSEDPQSGQGYGQRLSLYASNELRCPIASWWLQPAVESVANQHAGYQKIMAEICSRYGIGRVFISSLVGHSLDALRSGLPTLHILHDHFPVWPLLSINPVKYLESNLAVNLKLALQENNDNQEFGDKSAAAWSDTSRTYRETIDKHDVKLAAPGQSVVDLHKLIDPEFETREIAIIEHGFPPMENLRVIRPRPRKDSRLRLLVLGRMQTGKGQQLLISALPELAKHVQVYLLGAGKSGEIFFGAEGVNVILDYQRDDLASILDDIGPDFAALLSVVPETFSYTLSELQQLTIPVIATNVGSFPGRIEHGKTGWLIEPDPQALISQVAELCASPEQINTVRDKLPGIKINTLEDMLKAYDELCPLPRKGQLFAPVETKLDQVQTAAANFQHSMTGIELNRVLKKGEALKAEIEQRTAWALKTGKQLKLEQNRREQWVDKLETEISRLQHIVVDLQGSLADKEARLAQLESDYQQIENQNTLILNSSSWKITRPLRASRRLAKNFILARAWNPARWPWLLSQSVRNLSTMGLSGTLQRLKYTGHEAVPEPQPTVDIEAIGDPEAPGAFPFHEHPEVSIVIPVYNKWVYTAACLRSLLEVRGRYSFEVIVVDDQSSDETAGRLANITGLTHLRNDKNLGFVGSCNHGAASARGEYLVLLNNDTQVTDGWLDELIETFERESDAGLVGARLIYPDGSLQESGGIVFSDGSGWNYGRGDDAENPKYHFLREVDYCSGACIALKKKYFQQLGALDVRYVPAYYEDTDLAFKVRESGLKVYIQPLSAVIHHEGITSGTDTTSGAKKYQVINQKKFIERWQNVLNQQPEKITNPDDRGQVVHASQHRIKGRILFIDATTPEPDKDSGSVRLINLMQCCRDLGYGVTFFADNRDYTGSYTRDLQKSGVEVLYHPWLDSLHDFFRDRGKEFDYVFISRHYIAINYISQLKRYCPEAKFIFDTVDLHYLREQRLAEMENSLPLKRTAEQTRRAEMTVIKASDATLVVSTVEKEVLAEDAPGEKVHILSNIHEVPGRSANFAGRKDIYFVGGYQHPPNVDAACWFVYDVWPLIHKQLPDIHFHLIGSKAPERVRTLNGDGVIFHGFVGSLDPFLSGCRLAVAPLRYGAGVKGKVNMSMAHGQPVVATPAAIEGMFAEHERELLVAVDAAAFADEVVRLYQDETLWNRLSDASVKNVEKHFSLTTARASLTELFDSISDL